MSIYTLHENIFDSFRQEHMCMARAQGDMSFYYLKYAIYINVGQRNDHKATATEY